MEKESEKILCHGITRNYTAKNSTSCYSIVDWLNNAVTTRLSSLNNVVQRTMFTIVSTMLFSIDEATTVVNGC